MAGELNLSNPTFKAFVFYTVICIMKMFTVALLTVFKRLTKHVYSVPEDVKAFHKDKNAKPRRDDEVERIRSIHQNDVENVPLFLILGLLYVTIDPSYATALWHFRLFTFSRLLHTVCYMIPIPSPARSVCYTIGTLVNVSMIVRLLMATF